MKPNTNRIRNKGAKTVPVITTIPAKTTPQTINIVASPAAAPVAAPAPAPLPAPKPAPVAPEGVPVAFELFEPRAKQVSLCSEFNGWSPEATPLRPCGGGHWSATIPLKAGRYEYKFMVDGQWVPDPNARENRFNSFGTLNSVVEVQA